MAPGEVPDRDSAVAGTDRTWKRKKKRSRRPRHERRAFKYKNDVEIDRFPDHADSRTPSDRERFERFGPEVRRDDRTATSARPVWFISAPDRGVGGERRTSGCGDGKVLPIAKVVVNDKYTGQLFAGNTIKQGRTIVLCQSHVISRYGAPPPPRRRMLIINSRGRSLATYCHRTRREKRFGVREGRWERDGWMGDRAVSIRSSCDVDSRDRAETLAVTGRRPCTGWSTDTYTHDVCNENTIHEDRTHME